jgi:hypothetical protein
MKGKVMNAFIDFGCVLRLVMSLVLTNVLLYDLVFLSADETSKTHVVITSEKIANEIAPFVDEDTALICYIDCEAMNNLHKLSVIFDEATDDRCNAVGASVKQVLLAIKTTLQTLKSQPNKHPFTPLLDAGINRMYIVLNMKYLHVGAFYVIPLAGRDDKKISVIEKFFQIDNKKNSQTWITTKDDFVIIGGNNMILSNINFCFEFLPSETISLTSMLTDSYRYKLDEKFQSEYRANMFKNFHSQKSEMLLTAIREIESCDAIKLIFLYTDSIVANEFLWTKKMKPPVNQTALQFLSTSRTYAVLGIDTNTACIQLTIQTSSVENANKTSQYILTIMQALISNYFELPSIHHLDYDRLMSDKNEWTKFIMLIMPRVEGNKLKTVIDQNFFKKLITPK